MVIPQGFMRFVSIDLAACLKDRNPILYPLQWLQVFFKQLSVSKYVLEVGCMMQSVVIFKLQHTILYVFSSTQKSVILTAYSYINIAFHWTYIVLFIYSFSYMVARPSRMCYFTISSSLLGYLQAIFQSIYTLLKFQQLFAHSFSIADALVIY